MEEQLNTQNEFGESDFGKRLSYSRPQYRDPVFAVLYILHVLAMVVVAVYLVVGALPSLKDESNGTSSSLDFDFDLTGIIIGCVSCLVASILFGFLWLNVMKRYAGTIIKGMIAFNIAIWVIVSLSGLLFWDYGGIGMTISGAIVALFYTLWAWCIWGRIPFASALLGISSAVITRFQGTVVISLLVILLDVFWLAIWFFSFVTYIVVSNKTVTNDDGTITYEKPSDGIIFLFLISLYWALEVNKNISHTTTCGVTATWYFSNIIEHKPTPSALKRTLTTSFGSVCLGSLVVAILQAMRSTLRSMKRGRNPVFIILAFCLLGCIEALIRYFNKYAFAQCAIYGTSFVESAKATWNLFLTRGILAIINDDLTGMAVMCGVFISGLLVAALGAGIGYVSYSGHVEDTEILTIIGGMALFGFCVGIFLTSVILQVVLSAVVCLFVCFSEDPAAMQSNHTVEYDRVVGAKPSWGGVMQFAVGPRAPVTGNGNMTAA